MNRRSITFFILVAFTPPVVIAEDVTITVKGMVCAFCAQGIKKSFNAISSVERVEPDLNNKTVFVSTKKDMTLSNEDIKRVITDAGYEVLDVKRK